MYHVSRHGQKEEEEADEKKYCRNPIKGVGCLHVNRSIHFLYMRKGQRLLSSQTFTGSIRREKPSILPFCPEAIHGHLGGGTTAGLPHSKLPKNDPTGPLVGEVAFTNENLFT